MNVIYGDLISLAEKGEFDVIIHGCNCFCTMGSGIAKTIKDKYPAAYEEDCRTPKGSKEKLGTYSSVKVGLNNQFYIVNAYTQYSFSRGKIDVSYEAVRKVFELIKCDFGGSRIGYPMIGAGLAGGDWAIIEEIILETLTGENHTLVKYKPTNN